MKTRILWAPSHDIGGADPLHASGPPGDEALQTTSLLSDLRSGGGAGDAGVITSGERGRKIPIQTIIIVVVMVAGAMALYGMRRYGMGAGMTFQPVVVHYDPSASQRLAPAEEQRVLAALEHSGAPVQVPSDAIQKNPFQLDVSPQLTQIGPVGPSAEAREAERRRIEEMMRAAEREKLLNDTASRLRVTGVIGGPVPVARINGRPYRTGDTVQELFKVASIDAAERRVSLEADGRTFVISMSEELERELRR